MSGEIASRDSDVTRVDGSPSLAKLKRYFTEARDLTQQARTNALTAIDYYDSDQFTGADLAKLHARGQPPVVINRIKPAINGILSNSSLSPNSAGYIGAPPNGQNNNYTFALSDAGGCVICSSTGGFAWTIPPVSSVAFPQGTIILVRNRAAGAITITPASGVVLRKAGISGSASVSLAIWGFATMMMDETNEWVISGAAIS